MRIKLYAVILVIVFMSIWGCINPRPQDDSLIFESAGFLYPVDTVGNFELVTHIETADSTTGNANMKYPQVRGIISINYLADKDKIPAADFMPQIRIDSFCVWNERDGVPICQPVSMTPPTYKHIAANRWHAGNAMIKPFHYIKNNFGHLAFSYQALYISPNTGAIMKRLYVDDTLYNFSDGTSWVTNRPAPNPFSPTTEFTYIVSESTQVSFIIYNVEGQAVDTLVNETQGPGYYEKQWNPTSALPSGVYFYRLKIGSAPTITKKLVLLR